MEDIGGCAKILAKYPEKEGTELDDTAAGSELDEEVGSTMTGGT